MEPKLPRKVRAKQANTGLGLADAVVFKPRHLRFIDERRFLFSDSRELKYLLKYQSIFIPQSTHVATEGHNMRNIQPAKPMAATKPAVKAKVETITLKHLAMALAEGHGVKKAQVNAMLMGMVEDITKHLKKGKRIRLNGLGILQVRKRPARMGRNPATGEPIKIKASKKVAFRASKEFKEMV